MVSSIEVVGTLSHQICHRFDMGQELINNTVGALHFKDTAAHQTESINKLFAETVVIE